MRWPSSALAATVLAVLNKCSYGWSAPAHGMTPYAVPMFDTFMRRAMCCCFPW